MSVNQQCLTDLLGETRPLEYVSSFCLTMESSPTLNIFFFLGTDPDWSISDDMEANVGKHDKEVFELYITTAPIPDLNEKLNVFGRVIRGEDVVQEIEEVDTDEHYRPKSPIGIFDITLEQKGSEDAKKLVNQERVFACAEIESARAVVQRIEEALDEQEKILQNSGNSAL